MCDLMMFTYRVSGSTRLVSLRMVVDEPNGRAEAIERDGAFIGFRRSVRITFVWFNMIDGYCSAVLFG